MTAGFYPISAVSGQGNRVLIGSGKDEAFTEDFEKGTSPNDCLSPTDCVNIGLFLEISRACPNRPPLDFQPAHTVYYSHQVGYWYFTDAMKPGREMDALGQAERVA